MSAGHSGLAQLGAILLAVASAASHTEERRPAAGDPPMRTGNPVVDHIGPDILGDGGAE